MSDVEFFCPMLKRVIAEGYCYDLNADLEGMFRVGLAQPISAQLGLSRDQMKRICIGCEHYPF